MKVLICDDDISTVDVILNHIPWDDLEVDHVLHAYNGLEAKKIISAEKPEIIVSDIGMPLCNGIEVLKYIREIGLKSEFIFLTCYESFEFAREAIRYGATRYITKPLNLDELENELRQIITEVRAQNTQQSQSITAQREQGLAINTIIRGLRDGLYGTDIHLLESSLRKRRLPIRPDEPFRYVLTYGEISGVQSADWPPEALCYSFSSLAQEVIADRLDFQYSSADNNESTVQLLMLIPAEKFTETELLDRCRRFCTVAYAYTRISPVCVVGDIMPFYQTRKAAADLQAKLNKLRFQSGQAFLLRDAVVNQELAHPDLDETQLLNYLKRQDKPSYLRFITEYIRRLSATKGDSGLQLTLLHHALLQAFYRCIRDNQLSPYMIFSEDEMRRIDGKSERSGYDMICFASALFDRVSLLLAKYADNGNTLEAAKQYIQQHFREDIDRNAVARVACITPNYLSKRFHSETGMSLREYVNKLRIDEAKRLLLSTGKTVSEIAGEVGFDNISYFSTVFRKQCGMSPLDWKAAK